MRGVPASDVRREALPAMHGKHSLQHAVPVKEKKIGPEKEKTSLSRVLETDLTSGPCLRLKAPYMALVSCGFPDLGGFLKAPLRETLTLVGRVCR